MTTPNVAERVWHEVCGKLPLDENDILFTTTHTHNGPGGYLDHESFLPDGRSYFDYTVDTIAELITAYPDVIPEEKIGAPTLP